MIELLVVIAVSALLTALLLPALSRAHQAADSVVCQSNLHQLGLALNMYVHDSEAYLPSAMEEPELWLKGMESYTGAKWPERNFKNAQSVQRISGVFVCPAYNRLKGIFLRESSPGVYWLLGSYAYNSVGVCRNGDSGYGYLGLGGRDDDPGPPYRDQVHPIKPADVVNPSQMIALGDNPMEEIGAWGGPEMAGCVANRVDLSLGFHGAEWIEVNRPSYVGPTSAIDRSRARIRQRHRGRWNITFCDGHLETLKTAELFGRNPLQVRRWNNDYEPHLEFMPFGGGLGIGQP